MSELQAKIDQRRYSDNIPHPRPGSEQNFFAADPNLHYLLQRYLPAAMHEWATQQLHWLGAQAAGPLEERAAYTDREGKPRLRKYNRLGEDVSEIITNEGYKETVADVYGAGIVSYLYHDIPELGRKAPYSYSFLMGYLVSQTEPGFYCPVTLTMSAAYLIDRYGSDAQKKQYLSGLTSRDRTRLYEGATWLTERQGGSDVGANLTVAKPVEGQSGVYRLTGEKFFASNAGAMVATVLARIDESKPGTKGLGLFLVPWLKPDGTRNQIEVRRLKDKLGVNAVPSAEILLHGAEGYLIGQPENGFKYMAEALNLSRICNAVASIGIMRRALYEAKYYASQRRAFQNPIDQYPMVREMLVSLLLDTEVSTGAVFDMIAVYDRLQDGSGSREDMALARLLIPLLKYRTGEEAVEAAHAAIEIHGGNGFIEEYVTPRLLRDAQVLTVWEGTSNILALDILRVMQKENSHVVFARLLRSRSEGWRHAFSQPFAELLQAELAVLEENIAYLFRQSPDYVTYKLKALADHMIDLYALSCIVSEAEDQVAKDNNARKYVLAKLYAQKHLTPKAKRGIQGDELLDVQFFRELLDCEPIPVEALQQQTAFASAT
ncbi:acyl-CoA dehydrogenase family protein [Brevibacillus agri]|uniref:acyl-CoA dehydrogenase family protein n=1 Tax=Brevibacillus TaxID=55080 RepID=UPI000271B26A|nr:MULTISPECIES: acyl-CoA dehydrogenase family protein [Brevibacillus]ELK39318.1 acyl-CoA dehydrogenase [Brevibacillus agri BAB-2500]EJL47658.1 acyl-CoA dehydrogenase [Brevibacillus sp. CF112]MED1642770.1 acyl-CoA dehydrogenase family protein [Brevibacillus agri]MED1656727.1 acyl-CoA dehydrogenase family protein [Brevibacillus agri]MED1687665.1 acyl-CoA dehydrogenase family protein [Brevibacillus agri]